MMEDCVVCTDPADVQRLQCGCRVSVHPRCLAAWTASSNRQCLLLCDARARPPQLEEAVQSLVCVVVAWMMLCGIVMFVGAQWVFGMCHFLCACNVWVQTVRHRR